MNSTARVQAALASFLADPEPGVIALKGDWGVGKTYVWKEFIQKQKMVPGYRAYSYVSLFGIGAIPELRRAIFANQRTLGKWYHWLGHKLRRVTSGAARHVDIDLGSLKVPGVNLKNTELWADAIEARALRHCIVCLDDLERKEESVTTSALLGYITSLRDERRCKVVLLYNANKAEEGKKFSPDLDEYREKVIDREVELQPTVPECYSLIFTDARFDLPAGKPGPSNPFQLTDHRSILELFQALDLANIRVMRKTHAALGYFADEIMAKYPRLWPIFARQVVKLSCLHYLHGKDFKLDDIIDHQRWLALYGRREEDDTFEHKYAPVNKVSYHPLPGDRLILEYLTTGYVDWSTHAELLTAQEEEQKRLEVGKTFRANWDLLWDNFQATEDQFVDAQMAFLEKHHAQMSLAEVSQVVEFLRRLRELPRAEEILTAKIDEFAALAVDAGPFDTDLFSMSKEVVQRVHAKLNAKVVVKPISEAVAMMTREGGWTPSDIRYLQSYTDGDFYSWLQTETAPGLLRQIKTFRERFGGDPAGKDVVAKLDTALLKMADRSKADAQRVFTATGLRKPAPPPAPE
jgi:hypothetical protein